MVEDVMSALLPASYRPTRPVDLDQPKSPAADSSKSPDIGRRLESAGVSLLFPALAFFLSEATLLW